MKTIHRKISLSYGAIKLLREGPQTALFHTGLGAPGRVPDNRRHRSASAHVVGMAGLIPGRFTFNTCAGMEGATA